MSHSSQEVSLRAAQNDESGVFDSVLVHFGSDKARFQPADLKIRRSILTLPTAWHFKPMTEVDLKLLVPSGKTGKTHPIQCRGIIIDCRPLKSREKGRFQVDLLLTEIPSRYAGFFQKNAHALAA